MRGDGARGARRRARPRRVPDKPLDVLAQQIVAEVAAAGGVGRGRALRALLRGAYPYRNLARERIRRRRRDARARLRDEARPPRRAHPSRRRQRQDPRAQGLAHDRDHVRRRDSRSVRLPRAARARRHFIGTLNEDFAIESLPGDIFQLGNTSWRILRIGSGVVRVADAQGQPPSMPFWLGEAPARSDEMSAAVSRLRAAVDCALPGPDEPRSEGELEPAIELARARLRAFARRRGADRGLPRRRQARLGVVPTAGHDRARALLRRVRRHAARAARAVRQPRQPRVGPRAAQEVLPGLQLRAAGGGDRGGPHPLARRRRIRSRSRKCSATCIPNTVRETLVQAVLDSPIFETRWRWTHHARARGAAQPRRRARARQLQRMYAEDLLQGVFPDAVACLDNIQGAREIPDHPLVNQALRDALEEAMDLPRARAHPRAHLVQGEISAVARDTPEPSVFCHELLNSAVYTFLDDAPLEERRTHAVYTRRATELRNADDLGALDPAAIERVREEAWPVANTRRRDARRADARGLHRGEPELAPHWRALARAQLGERVGRGKAERVVRATSARTTSRARPRREPAGSAGAGDRAATADTRRRHGIARRSKGRAASCADDSRPFEGQSPNSDSRTRIPHSGSDAELEWCDRRLLARIHRYTLNRLRAEIEPVTRGRLHALPAALAARRGRGPGEAASKASRR